jgi:TRAP-type C4-dicarboxylate transport system substrate-binding protein
VLTLVRTDAQLPGGIGAFVEAVDRLSQGSIELVYDDDIWSQNDPAQEIHLIEDVQAGNVDVAWFGARALDSFGVTSFQALLAPFLVDSYELQDRVFEAGIPTRMLDGVQDAGLVGIGVQPGLLRRMIGIADPFVTPDDFADAVVGTSGGELAKQTFRTLGAIPKQVPTPTTLEGLDALDYPLAAVYGNGYNESADFVMANLNFWPRPFVIVMNPDRFAELTVEQQQILRTAADEASLASEQFNVDDDSGAKETLCTTDMNIVRVSDSQQAALTQAVEPIYAELESNTETKAFLDEIRALKQEIGRPADSFDCPGTQASTDAAATPIDGVYRTTTTAADLLAAGDPQPIVENYGDWVWVFDRGRFAFAQENGEACTWGYGNYVVDGDQLVVDFAGGGGDAPNNASNKPGELFVFRWSLYRDTLTLEAVEGEISPENFRARPWRTTGEPPASTVFPERCPPPAEALNVG